MPVFALLYTRKIRLFPVFPNRLLCGLLLRIRLLRLLGRFLIGCLYSLGILFQFFLAVKIDVRAFQRLRRILHPVGELLKGQKIGCLYATDLPIVFHIISHVFLTHCYLVPIQPLNPYRFQCVHKASIRVQIRPRSIGSCLFLQLAPIIMQSNKVQKDPIRC